MPISFTCSSCGRALNVRDELAGRQIYCPDCKSVLTVPFEAAPEPESEPASTPPAAAEAPADDLLARAEEPPPPAEEPPPPPRPVEVGRTVSQQLRMWMMIGGVLLMGGAGTLLYFQLEGGFRPGAMRLVVILFIFGISLFIRGVTGKTD